MNFAVLAHLLIFEVQRRFERPTADTSWKATRNLCHAMGVYPVICVCLRLCVRMLVSVFVCFVVVTSTYM